MGGIGGRKEYGSKERGTGVRKKTLGGMGVIC